MNKQLINKIQANTASVGEVGLGYIGLPLVLRFAEVGIKELDFELRSEALSPESIGSYDALLLATNHDEFDYQMIQKHARLSEKNAILD
jgi:UDP-N-acetyl-D-mannosaminuronate dehydrogenase